MQHQIPIIFSRTEIYDLCDALTTEADRYAGLVETRIDAPAAVKREWSAKVTSTRELSRRLIAECFSGHARAA